MQRGFADRSDMEAEANLKISWRGRISLLAAKDRAEMFTNQPSPVYIEMPFNNPDGESTHPDDRAMGKYL